MATDELKPVESGFGKKTFNRIFLYLNENRLLLSGRPGWQKTKQGIVPPPFPTPAAIAEQNLWGLTVTDADTAQVKLSRAGTIKRTSALDNSGLITITDEASEFTAAVGSFLVIEFDVDLNATLKVTTQWTGYPYPAVGEESDPPGIKVLDKYYLVLWEFLAPDDADAFSIRVNDEIAAEKRTLSTNFQMMQVMDEDSTGAVLSFYAPWPAMGCAR